MDYQDNHVSKIKIAYIGGGSRQWAWTLMMDLASTSDISGEVYLYDINFDDAKKNEIIGNKINNLEDCKSIWNYTAVKTIKEALTDADFVIISITPGNFNEMYSDVHTPEKYGIYQSVGDTTGPGGIIRALRTIPMIEYIANSVKEYCPNAWVINYTNPMTICVKTLYRVFPKIKAFGCCHEVFGTQRLLRQVYMEKYHVEEFDRAEIKVNVVGVNHFTWITKAQYKNVDLLPIFAEFVEKNYIEGNPLLKDADFKSNPFSFRQRVAMDLFRRYNVIAAAGDRHLAEFCEGSWYLKNPEQVYKWNFGLTDVDYRKSKLEKRIIKSEKLINNEEEITIKRSDEEGVDQIRALLGLCELVTNVNIPNVGQIPNLPLGAIVETNAVFRSNSVEPVMAGNIPESIYSLITRIVGEQELISTAGEKRNLKLAFNAFFNDPLVSLDYDTAKKLFDEMIENTKEYLKEYFENN